MEMNFCRRCGNPLLNTQSNEYRCGNGHILYTNPAPTSGIFLITPAGQVALSVRGLEPHIGKLDTFGGFINTGETAEEALIRELQEELGLEPSEYTTPHYLTSAASKYTHNGEEYHILGSFFWAYLLTDRQLTPADDVADIHIAPINAINSDLLHNDDIKLAFAALQKLWPSIAK